MLHLAAHDIVDGQVLQVDMVQDSLVSTDEDPNVREPERSSESISQYS